MMTWREATKLGTANLMALAQEHNVIDQVLAIKSETRYWYFKACSLIRNTVNSIQSEVQIVDSTPFDGKTATLAKPLKQYDVDGMRYALDNSDFTSNEKFEGMTKIAMRAFQEYKNDETSRENALAITRLAANIAFDL